MQIYLYKINYRKNDIKKTFTASNTVTMTGSLRFPTNHLNPIIRIDRSSLTDLAEIALMSPYPTVNYAYVPDLNRYYFITNITAFATNIFDLYLHVDVLMTYIGQTGAPLRSKSVFVERSADSQIYNELYEDNRVSFMSNNSISFLTFVISSFILYKSDGSP